MSEDKSRKTEEPTKHRLKEARKQGQIPRSRDVVSTAVIIVMFVFIWVGWDYYMQILQEMIISATTISHIDFDMAYHLLSGYLLRTFFLVIGPAIFLATVTVIGSNLMQFGFLLAPASITPDINKINPVSGFTRIFGVKNLMETVKAIVKILLLTIAIAWVISIHLPELINLIYCDVHCAHALVRRIIMYIALLSILMFIVMAVFDWWFQNQQYIKDNRMTRDEVKRDQKTTEGDPMMKRQRKTIQRESLQQGDLTVRIKEAIAFIVSGEMVIGLFYQEGETPLPKISIKEKGETGSRIMQTARRLEIPAFHNEPLTRQLWEKGKVDQFMPTLPPELVRDVAKIIVQATQAQKAREAKAGKTE